MKKITIMVVCLVLTACAVKTEPLADKDYKDRASSDVASLFSGQAGITAPITLGEAIARALSYNMDARLKQMELAFSVRKYETDRNGLLPKLVANAGYSERDNDAGARSINIETGEESLPASSSQERETETSNIALTWSLLDFGLGHYIAQQSGNEILIANERRRKTIQNITQDVIDAFWKSWMAQTLEPKIESLLVEARAALASSRSLVARGIQNSDDALRSQASLLGTINSLIETRERISLSKTRLSALMNIKHGTEFQVAVPTSLDVPAELSQSTDQLVDIALANRPELREEDYKKRNVQLEAKKAFLSLFPNLTLNAGRNRDENAFLINNSWKNVGIDLTWDLMGVFTAGSKKRFNDANIALADVRRQALSMAVMTQVYLSVARYDLARSRYLAASDLYEIRNSLARNSSASGSRVSGMEELNARSTAIASELRRSIAFAESQAAFARIVNTMGIDLLPKTLESNDLNTLSSAFDSRWASMMKGVLVSY